jgi:hypothetical protein
MEKVFGISKLDRFYLVWEAPAPEDSTEPKYVKPLHISTYLPEAEELLHAAEKRYADECLKKALHYADAEGDPYAGTAQES